MNLCLCLYLNVFMIMLVSTGIHMPGHVCGGQSTSLGVGTHLPAWLRGSVIPCCMELTSCSTLPIYTFHPTGITDFYNCLYHLHTFFGSEFRSSHLHSKGESSLQALCFITNIIQCIFWSWRKIEVNLHFNTSIGRRHLCGGSFAPQMCLVVSLSCSGNASESSSERV